MLDYYHGKIQPVIFALFFWNFNSDLAAREQAKETAKRIEREAKAKAETDAKIKAIENANILQEKRKAEKAEREKRMDEEKQIQFSLKDASDKARDDSDRVLR